MSVTPIYVAEDFEFAYQLNWSLTLFWRSIPKNQDWFYPLLDATEADGVRILEISWPTERCTQFLISTRPETRPQDIAWSVKGRLQYLVRKVLPAAFQRNFDLRSIGSTTREKTEAYVAGQLLHHAPENARLRAEFDDIQFSDPNIDLGKPRFSNHARFWCNLHFVFVRDWRIPELDRQVWLIAKDIIRRSAAKHGHRLSRLGIVPDHVHLVTGINTSETPAAVALSYMNNIAYSQGMQPCFMRSAFIGTVGEYDLGAIR